MPMVSKNANGWVYKSEWDSLCPTEETLLDLLDNQCFSAALHLAINHPSPPLSDSLRRPRAVSWFNLEVNPALKNDVVAVVIPIVGWKRTSILQLLETCDKNANVEGDWDNPCYVEMHHCIQGWRLTQLLNLRVVVALPWPDLIPHYGKQNLSKNEGAFMDLRSGIEGIDFDSNMPTFLQSSDVVIIMDDCSDRRASLSKALRSRSPIRQKSTKRSRFSLQEEDFRHFKPTGIFISTCPVENFSFSALAMALRNQTLSGAAFTIPMDGSLSSDELQSLYHMKNVLAVPPPSAAGFAPKLLRRQLAGLVLQAISEGLGLPFLGSSELTPPSDLKRTSSLSMFKKPKSRAVPNLTAKFRSALRSGRSGRECRQERSQSVSVR
ncbi:hypothetical protein TSMEX_007059 [Taenia solium]|eukprot:TsM_000773400 transcript=TsM_000773400 gene=TsM_000773400